MSDHVCELQEKLLRKEEEAEYQKRGKVTIQSILSLIVLLLCRKNGLNNNLFAIFISSF